MKKYKGLLVFLSLILAVHGVFPSAMGSETVICSTAEDIHACSSSVAALPDGVKVSSRFWELLRGNDKEEKCDEEILLIPGGGVFGARVKLSEITVSDPGGRSQLKEGDTLLSINGQAVSSVSEVQNIIPSLEDGEINATFKRNGSTFSLKLTKEGGKLGITLRDGAAGIGTITYIDPTTGLFGGLGHGICDAESGDVIQISGGSVTGVILGGVHKGTSGKPGELSGILTDRVVGTVTSNTECGVFGKLDTVPSSSAATAIPVGHKNEVTTGEAYIYSTLKNGKCAKYKIEIIEIDQSSTATKSFKIRVTDPALIAITGGIVKGMSGSPIIQNGKLIGAVTHVMVANPTEGYGIFIENMLNAGNNRVQTRAA